jgi:hypothetical protein
MWKGLLETKLLLSTSRWGEMEVLRPIATDARYRLESV